MLPAGSIAANPTQIAKMGVPWALGLSTEAGLIVDQHRQQGLVHDELSVVRRPV